MFSLPIKIVNNLPDYMLTEGDGPVNIGSQLQLLDLDDFNSLVVVERVEIVIEDGNVAELLSMSVPVNQTDISIQVSLVQLAIETHQWEYYGDKK